MTEYNTETGFYVLCDAEGNVCAKANVPVGTHSVAGHVDPDESFDVADAEDLAEYGIHEDYRDERS